MIPKLSPESRLLYQTHPWGVGRDGLHVLNSGKNDFSKFIDVEDHAGGVGLADLIDLVVGAIVDQPLIGRAAAERPACEGG